MEVKGLWEIIFPRLQAQIQEGLLDVAIIADFCKAAPITVRSWINNEHPAEGQKLIRLWHLLALNGSAPEIDKMPELNRILSQLYAFDVMSIEEVQLYAGLNSPKGGHSYKVLRGQRLLHPSATASEVEAEYGQRLRDAKKAFRGGDLIVFSYDEDDQISVVATPLPESDPEPTSAPEPIPEPVPEPVSAILPPQSLLTTDSKLLLATLLGASAPIAKQLNSNASTAEERSKFRELLGAEVLFELSNTLNALCSERARGMAR